MFRTFIFSVIVIIIIHLFIRYLLQSDKLYKLNNKVTEEGFSEPFTNEIVEENHQEEHSEIKEEFDLNKMKNELMNYIVSDKEIYNSGSNNVKENAKDEIQQSNSDFQSSDEDISKFFVNEVDTNDIKLYTDEEAVKQCEKKTDTNKTADNKIDEEPDDMGRWNYDNEKPLNGGDTGGGIIGYDMTGGSYATI